MMATLPNMNTFVVNFGIENDLHLKQIKTLQGLVRSHGKKCLCVILLQFLHQSPGEVILPMLPKLVVGLIRWISIALKEDQSSG